MPRPAKTRICSETEKRKAEIFSHIDTLIISGCWNKARKNLQYLYRNAPSVRPHVQRKLAWLYFETKNYQKSLAYLQNLLPTNDAFLNRIVIECLLGLNKKDYAILHLAKAPLTVTKKRELFFLIFPELKNRDCMNDLNSKFPQVTIRCPKCTRVLFFARNLPICLFCET